MNIVLYAFVSLKYWENCVFAICHFLRSPKKLMWQKNIHINNGIFAR